MTLADLVAQRHAPAPWSEGEKIPWNEPGFSRRMLAEHLNPDHDRASRRSETIAAHVQWIHEAVLAGRRSRVVDLGCGPGLYLQGLAAHGHAGVGVDFSPASIAWAREQAAADCDLRFEEADLRVLDLTALGGPFDLAMLLFGEANVFRPEQLAALLGRVASVLPSGGQLLVEPHTWSAVETMGQQTPSWYAQSAGLFSEDPHLCLHEGFWDADQGAATERWWIVDAASGSCTRHAQSCQAYSEDGYRELLQGAGFVDVEIGPGLAPDTVPRQPGLCTLRARRAT